MAQKVICIRQDCFMNKCGVFCELLKSPTDQNKPCPFYKTEEQAQFDQMDAHARLKKLGREDLIQKYEYNPERKGQW